MKREKDMRRDVGVPDEYELRRCASGHYEIVAPNGSTLRMPNGVPVTLSYSPGDSKRSRRNERARVKRALAAREGDRHTHAPGEQERPA